MGILKPRYGGTGLGGGFSSGNIIWAVDEQTLTTGAVSSLPGLAEAIQDVVGAMAVAGTGISIVYDDGLGTLTVSNTGVTSVGRQHRPQRPNHWSGGCTYVQITRCGRYPVAHSQQDQRLRRVGR